MDCGKEPVERKPVESPPSQAVGPAPQKIMAGGDLTHNVTHTNTNTTTVYNQDETKQVQTCAVSGRQAEIIKGNRCPSCGLWVHGDYFDHDTKLCTTCNSKKAKGAQQTFRDKVSEFLSDEQISQDEIQFLRDFGGRLNLSVAEQDNMIATVKKERVQNSSLPLSRIEKVKFDSSTKILLDENYEDVSRVGKLAAMRTLEALCERHPNNMEVAGSLVLAYMIAPMTGGEDLKQAEGRWAEKVQQRVRISPAFAHDTENKYFYMCMAAGGLLLEDRIGKHIQQLFLSKISEEQITAVAAVIDPMMLNADEYRLMDQLNIDACSELEKAFPESDEWMCVELMLMFEEYFTNGHDPAIKSEILQVLPDTSGEITGDIGAVLQIVREKLVTTSFLQDESFALLEKEKREGLSGYGQMIYYSLFCSFKDVANKMAGEFDTLFKGDHQDADKEQAEEDEIILASGGDGGGEEVSVAPPPLPGESAVPPSTTPSRDSDASMEELQQRLKWDLQALAVDHVESVDGFYIPEDLPKKKISGAITGYLPADKAGEILFLYDDTVFGGAKEGLCFTGDAIYFKELAEAANSVRLEDIERFTMLGGKLNDELSIHLHGGTVVKYSFTSDKAKAHAMEQVLQASLDLFRVIIV